MNTTPRVPRQKSLVFLGILECIWFFVVLSFYAMLYLIVGAVVVFKKVAQAIYAWIDEKFFGVCEYASDPVEGMWANHSNEAAWRYIKYLDDRTRDNKTKMIIDFNGNATSPFDIVLGQLKSFSICEFDSVNRWIVTLTIADAIYLLSKNDPAKTLCKYPELVVSVIVDFSHMDEAYLCPKHTDYTIDTVHALYKNKLKYFVPDVNQPIYKELLVNAD